MTDKKKLIEVALPLEAINRESAREKSIRHGHPSTLHLWWARRPLAAARAVIFAQMVDDPSAHPERFPTEQDQDKERARLLDLLERLVLWESSTDERVLQEARDAIWQSWRDACASNIDHPHSAELFDPSRLPAFHDPFAGGGALPLEAQRLGLESYATDLNPVAVLICKALIEFPARCSGMAPISNAHESNRSLLSQEWSGAEGLAHDVRYYGEWMRDEAEKRIGHLYPDVEVTEAMALERPDLKPQVGRQLKVIAWLWARTVRTPNPAFGQVEVPLTSTFMLSTRAGKESFVEPVIAGGEYHFTVRTGRPAAFAAVSAGTKLGRGANFKCLLSGVPIPGDYIKAEGVAGRIGSRLMAAVVETDRGRTYLSPTAEMQAAAHAAQPSWRPDLPIDGSTQYVGVRPYGMERFGDIFTDRQLVALTTLADLVKESRALAYQDALDAGLPGTDTASSVGCGASEYADAIALYLAFVVDKGANMWSSLCFWMNDRGAMRETYARQVIPIVWDFAEANPFSSSGGNLRLFLDKVTMSIASAPCGTPGHAVAADAATQDVSTGKVVW